MTPQLPDDSGTPIGVDVGETNLYTACPAGMPDWRGAYRIPGQDVCTQLDALREQTVGLLGSKFGRETVTEFIDERERAIIAAIETAAEEICEFASAYDDPIIVLEDSNHKAELWDWLVAADDCCGTSWLLPTLHDRLVSIAAQYAIEVVTVPAEYSSQECHDCGCLGERVANETFECTNADCHVSKVHADYNAAKVLGERYRRQADFDLESQSPSVVLPAGGDRDV